MANTWIKVSDQLPPKGRIVETKIDDEHGERNIREGINDGSDMWWNTDRSMYWYYTPTHWRYV